VRHEIMLRGVTYLLSQAAVLQMPRYLNFIFAVIVGGLLASCALQQAQPPLISAVSGQRMQKVRTTAYTHTERGGRHNALGMYLSGRHVMSAASDWSRFPVGTRFRIVDTQEEYVIDDYGTALVGTETIDLYKPTRLAMKRWGVRRVDIDVLQWGSAEQSLKVLGPRAKHRTVRRMIAALQKKTPGQPLKSVQASTSVQASVRRSSARTLD
jgi:3D (Asp-Asp-Asp) domain-containing protein